MLPHKMAVSLVLASEQLLSTLHKGTSVVVEDGLLVIQFQPAQLSAAGQLLFKPVRRMGVQRSARVCVM